MAKLMISSSGLRGIVGEHLTSEKIDHFIRAFLNWLPKGKIIIGGDSRTSHHAIEKMVSSICQLCGRDVICIGIVPTPTVQQMVRTNLAAGGIAITASHNPVEWNGLKIINSSGSFLSSEEYDAFFDLYQSGTKAKYCDWDNQGTYIDDQLAIDQHVDIIESVLDFSSLNNSTLKVLVDVNHGAATRADKILFKRLGIQVDYLFDECNGRFSHAPEPLAQNVTLLCEEMKKGSYDIGFAQDPDADRLVIVDENGTFIGEDYSLAFCMDYYLNQLKHTNPSIVVNLSTSRVINYIAEKYKGKLYQTRIGEPNVTAKIREVDAVIGGEGNGGIILPTVGWGRDSLTGIVLALLHLEITKKSVSDIIKTYPSYVMIRDKQPLENNNVIQEKLDKVSEAYANYDVNLDDGVKVSFKDSWVHIRASNTEPIIRIFAEAPTNDEALQLINKIKTL